MGGLHEKEILFNGCLLALAVMLFAAAGVNAQETVTYESTLTSNEDGTILISISKAFMDGYEETGVFQKLTEDIEARNDEYVTGALLVKELVDYGMTESGDIFYILTEEMYQEFVESNLRDWQERCEEQEEVYSVDIVYDRELTDVCLKIKADDYEKWENKKLLYALRGMEKIQCRRNRRLPRYPPGPRIRCRMRMRP